MAATAIELGERETDIRAGGILIINIIVIVIVISIIIIINNPRMIRCNLFHSHPRRPSEGAMFFLKREQMEQMGANGKWEKMAAKGNQEDSVTHHSYGK